MSINRVNISGNLTRDPELRATASGMSVMSFSVAVNDRRRNQQTGEWEDHPNFVDCTMFGTRAESVSRFLSKGSKVAIEGKLRWSSWERDGQKRSKLEVIVDDIEFFKSPYAPQAPTQQYQPQQAYGAQQAPQMQTTYQSQPVAPPAYQQASQPVAQPMQQQQQPQVVQASVYDEDIPF